MSGAAPVISLPTPPGGHLYAAEAGLPQGSQPGQAQTASSWTFSIRADDGVDDLFIGGYQAVRDGVFTAGGVSLPYGRLSVTAYDAATGEVTVGFQLTGAHQSQPYSQQRYGDIVTFDVTLTDRDGDTAQSNLVLQIRDDEGVRLSNDTATVAAGSSKTGNLVTDGSPDSFGADGFGRISRIANAERTVVDDTADADGRFSLQGRFGELTVSPTGVFTYTARADASEGSVDRFTYFAADADGDEAAATVTFTFDAAPPPSSNEEGRVYGSPGPGSTVTAGAGDDTLNASQGADVLTGGAGHDSFAFAALPWSAGHITDFMVGTDRLDLSRIFSAAGYSGDDPVADGRMRFDPDGAGGTKLYFDPDQLDGGEWPFHITTLDGVAPAGLTWAKLAGDAPPSSGGIGTGDKGQVIVSPGPGSVLTGGEGADTLVASQGKDRLTGAGGGDHFEFPKLPWNAGHVTDFDPAADRIDLSALFDEYPDGILEARAGAGGGTEVYFDRDQADGGDWPFLITRLDGISPAALGTDWVIV